LQNFQTIDITVPAIPIPASTIGRIRAYRASMRKAISARHHQFRVRRRQRGGEFPARRRSLRRTPRSVAGVSLVDRAAGYFFEPAVGWHLTQYSLQDPTPGDPSTPFRSALRRLDTGLIFERDAGSAGQRTETLEPRLVYSYVPYRNQDGLPVFDSALPDLNLSELFRTNRYVGEDRIGDANQLSMALTTRLFDQTSGQQYLSATLGQIRYFEVPRVTLPCQDQSGRRTRRPPARQTLHGLPGFDPTRNGIPASSGAPGAVVRPAQWPGATAPGTDRDPSFTTVLPPPEEFNASDLVGERG
jgi:hypothetical protein